MRKRDILHEDFKPLPYWWEAYRPAAGDLVDVPRQARVVIIGGGYAGLSCAIELADAGMEACVLEAAELGAGASTRSGGGVSGGVNIGKSFTGKVLARDPEVVKAILASGHDAFSLIETPDRARKDRLLLGEEGPLRRRLDTQGLHVSGEPRRQSERGCQFGRLHGAQGAPARGDGIRLLLRRHGGGALGQAAPRPLLQGPARCGAPAQDHDLRQGGGERIDNARQRLAHHHLARRPSRLATSSSPPTATRATRPRDLKRRLIPARQPHHRHRGTAGRPRAQLNPEGSHARRYQARTLLLSHVARQQAHDLRRTRAVHAGDAGGQRADPAPVHDGSLPAAAGASASPMPGPAMSPSPGTRCRIPASWTACIMRWAATAAASR